MKKPKGYRVWRQWGVDRVRDMMAGNATHGKDMRAFVEYEAERQDRAQLFAAIGVALTVVFSGVAAVASVLALFK